MDDCKVWFNGSKPRKSFNGRFYSFVASKVNKINKKLRISIEDSIQYQLITEIVFLKKDFPVFNKLLSI